MLGLHDELSGVDMPTIAAVAIHIISLRVSTFRILGNDKFVLHISGAC